MLRKEESPAPIRPALTLVGAGPGDPELLTLKGLHALQSANAVLYDALVDEALLQHVPGTAPRLFVGKRRGAKAFAQAEINNLIVGYARTYGHVVRLKGGDPFVFGRGLEEMEYAQAHGLSVAYIPGVSSAIGGLGAAGIAVTLRGYSRSFWTLTATTDTGELNPEIRTAAETDATVVILMGLAKLAEIAAVFRKAGKGNLPVAVIQNASLPKQRVAIGTVADIQEKVDHEQLGSPALVVLGKVVSRRFCFSHFASPAQTQPSFSS